MVKRGPKRKIIFSILIFILVIALAILIFELTVYINFRIGKDVLIDIKTDKEYLTTINSKPQDINFNIKVTANLFCATACNSEFIDLSTNNIISIEQFNLTSGISKTKEYSIIIGNGKGYNLYSFNIECKGIQTKLCNTRNNSYIRTFIVTVQHDLSQQEQEAKNKTKNLLEKDVQTINDIQSYQEEFNFTLFELNKKIDLTSLNKDFENLNTNLAETDLLIQPLLSSYNNQEYLTLYDKINLTQGKITNLENQLLDFNLTITNTTLLYNNLIDNLNLAYTNLTELKSSNFTNSSIISELNLTIIEFNSVVNSFQQKNKIEEKQNVVFNIINKVNNLNTKIKNETKTNLPTLTTAIKIPSEGKIQMSSIQFSQFSLEEPKDICCLKGNCQECYNNITDYPIIFLHGHAFSKDIEVDYSLDVFDKMQKKLEKEGYINAGSISLYTSKKTPKELWGGFNSPLSLRTSYYYDVSQDLTSYIYTPDNAENIDNYSLRLKDIIDKVKVKTGKPKVIIIAHSMGGLVSRRYIELFGEDSVDKLIMIGTPNYGITGKTQTICSLAGGKKECEDMVINSTFMKKLNPQEFKIPVYMFIGTGCKMDLGDGDGVVLKQNAKLLNITKTYYISGACNGLDLLHGRMLSPKEVPEVYDTIVKILKGEESTEI